MKYGHSVVVIGPEAERDIYNSIAHALDPDTGGDKTFGRLYTDGSTNYYAASTPCVDSFAATVQAVIDGNLPLYALVAQTYASRWPEEIPPSVGDCAAFMSSAVIRIDESFVDVLAELGLSAIPEEALIGGRFA